MREHALLSLGNRTTKQNKWQGSSDGSWTTLVHRNAFKCLSTHDSQSPVNYNHLFDFRIEVYDTELYMLQADCDVLSKVPYRGDKFSTIWWVVLLAVPNPIVPQEHKFYSVSCEMVYLVHSCTRISFWQSYGKKGDKKHRILLGLPILNVKDEVFSSWPYYEKGVLLLLRKRRTKCSRDNSFTLEIWKYVFARSTLVRFHNNFWYDWLHPQKTSTHLAISTIPHSGQLEITRLSNFIECYGVLEKQVHYWIFLKLLLLHK